MFLAIRWEILSGKTKKLDRQKIKQPWVSEESEYSSLRSYVILL